MLLQHLHVPSTPLAQTCYRKRLSIELLLFALAKENENATYCDRASLVFTLRGELRTLKLLACAFVGLYMPVVLLVFWHSGHHHACLASNAVCTDPTRAPRATRASWGDIHGSPLVLAHITDLHIGDSDSQTGRKFFLLFTSDVLPQLGDVLDAVLITGDLVHSQKYPLLHGLIDHFSKQDIAEWLFYNQTADTALFSLSRQVRWLTVPGNHDVFGSSDKIFYRRYGIFDNDQARSFRSGSRVFSTVIREHQIVLIDATLSPSPHRPLNFFGSFEDETARALERELLYQNDSISSVVVISHYPPAVMKNGARISETLSSAALTRKANHVTSTLLSGHLHTLYGLTPGGLQAVTKAGQFELQLPDLFGTAVFRLVVVDHGLVAWNDFTVTSGGEHIYAVVTNPPRAGLCGAGAGFAARQSSHIRFFVVSKRGSSSHSSVMNVFIDSEFVGKARNAERLRASTLAELLPNTMYIVPWDPALYWNDGATHKLEIYIGNASEPVLQHLFSLNGQLPDGFWQRWIIFVGAFFSLSRFDSLARNLVHYGLIVAIAASVHMLMSLPSMRVCGLRTTFLLLWIIGGGPFLIVPNLTESGGIGWVTLRDIKVAEGCLHESVDPYFGFIPTLFSSILPFCVANSLAAAKPYVLQSTLLILLHLLVLIRAINWTLKIVGAHSLLTVVVSPSCVPLVVLFSSTSYCLLKPGAPWQLKRKNA